MSIFSRTASITSLAIFCTTALAAPAEALLPENAALIASATKTTRQMYPPVDPATALSGAALLDALQKGGLALYLRHTETGAITEECNVSNLSPTGVSMARELGLALKQLRIPIGRVVSSPVCRVQETAQLLGIGKIELSDDLINTAKKPDTDLHASRMRQLAMVPKQNTNTLFVGHKHGGGKPHHAVELAFGEIIVFRPDGKGGSKPVARISAEDWLQFSPAKIAINDSEIPVQRGGTK